MTVLPARNNFLPVGEVGETHHEHFGISPERTLKPVAVKSVSAPEAFSAMICESTEGSNHSNDSERTIMLLDQPFPVHPILTRGQY
jgi:hypothetical protein